jgi:peptidoglycan/LPS O-acetylase OafA/YrhL
MSGLEPPGSMPAPSAEPAARLGHIDALRAIAALLVVYMHVSESFYRLSPQTESSRWLYDLAFVIDAGRIGVVAFFMISGFVIPFSARPERPAAGWDFAIKRLFRIYPAYWLSIFAGAFACYWLWDRPFGLREILVNLTLLQDLFGVPSAQGLYWTLIVELAFYAICLAFLLSGNIRNDRAIAFFATGLASVALLSLIATRSGTALFGFNVIQWFVHLSVMATGTLFRAWYDGGLRDRTSRALLWALLAFYLVGFPLVSTLVAGLPWRYTVPYASGVLLFVLGTAVVRISHPLMAWLGQISYSIYLFHAVVFYPLLWLLLQLPVEAWWRTRHLGFYLALNAVLTVLVASLVYRCVERPAIEYGKRVARRVAARRARDAQAAGLVEKRAG